MGTTHGHVKLTGAEVAYLWNTYIADTTSVCVFSYFLKHIEDVEIRSLISHGLDLSRRHIDTIQSIFKEEDIQVPEGFTKDDVNLNAARLFSDVFYIKYLDQMTKGGLATYSRILQNIYRDDIRSFFAKCITSTIELDAEVTRVLLEKGIATRPPTIPYPKEQEFIQKQAFFLEGLGRRDSLTGAEVAQLTFNIKTNQLGACLAIAFSQVAESKKVQKFFLRGKEIAHKHIKVFSDYLKNNSLPAPAGFEQEITVSTEAPFSEKLMMFHFAIMIYSGVGNYGVAISQSRRSDLAVDFSRLMAETLKFAEDGINLMIANKWLEQPPLAADRDGIVNDKQ